MNLKATVIRNTGAHYVARTADNKEIKCLAKGNFRIKGIRTTNPVAVGDHVSLGEAGPDGVAFITAVEPRRNYIIRRASNLSKAAHIIAANIDCAVLIATLAHPATSFNFIDRFLATAEAYNVPAALIINKTDLLTAPEDRQLLEGVLYLYRSIGYTAMAVSAATGEGLAELSEFLKDKVSLISGNSGVGKSTLINALIPGADVRTAEISASHDTGMHTTTFSEMYSLPGGGQLIDTPGVRGFGVFDFRSEDVGHYFPEIFKFSHNCRFGNCTHTHEPGCAVLEALENQYISQSRYNSYLSILEETNEYAEDKYRKGY
ncbi:MAG: ribosome small subunit-dependent GTPase A [Muribaculaceae bacterium]|jgi:ribosome biogenesis GTPase|nr:ribosome small subunit-dependent GTPase A [Muribaculaceae bacterium]